MDRQHFSLEINKGTRLTRFFQVVFGFLCALVAVIWAIMNINTLESNVSLWITIILLLGFAYYQVLSGFGMAEKFIEVGENSIRLKKNSLIPAREMTASEIQKTDIFPLNIKFHLHSGKTQILRFGTTYTDNHEPIIRAVENFCTANNISIEFMTEDI